MSDGLVAPVLAGFLPVLCFLAALMWLDSYKLVRLRLVLVVIAAGGVVAGASYLVNVTLLDRLDVDLRSYARYVAPLVEEPLKGLLLVVAVRSNRVGFLVDASIFGFAAGAGFAVVENAYYMQALPEAGLSVWLIRGFGTAVMHGGTTAILGITSLALAERRGSAGPLVFLPGLLLAVAVHSAFNHLFFSPVISTIAVLLAFPALILLVFERSERSLRRWLDVGFDADSELLELIHSGRLSDSRVGRYLQSLKERFRGEVVADLLCYLRLHVELSLRAKGLLLMRESGFEVAPDAETRAKFEELRYLERSIGKTGRLALAPFLHVSGKELWQMYMLGQ